jgi:hypothetical protein
MTSRKQEAGGRKQETEVERGAVNREQKSGLKRFVPLLLPVSCLLGVRKIPGDETPTSTATGLTPPFSPLASLRF